jgi:hypothetical protein
MESESSLPHSQVPATCPFPKPDRSSPYPHIPLPEDPSECYISIYVWASQVVSPPQISPPKPCLHLSSPHIYYMYRLSHCARFDHPNNIEWGVQIMKLLIMVVFFTNIINKTSRIDFINTARRSFLLYFYKYTQNTNFYLSDENHR